MALRMTPYVLIAAVAVAGALAVYGSSYGSSPTSFAVSAPAAPVDDTPSLPEMGSDVLPPNHPPIGDSTLGAAPLGASPHGASPLGASPHGASAPASDEEPAITWTVPKTWETAPNPNAMRLATYRPPAIADASSEIAEVSVARAGGAVEDNVQRWLAQFDAAGTAKRVTKDVRGVKIQVVEVTGTYQGNGMTPGAAPSSHLGWTLVGAIVETSSSSYFFKLLGPAAAVKSARPAFDAMLDGMKAL